MKKLSDLVIWIWLRVLLLQTIAICCVMFYEASFAGITAAVPLVFANFLLLIYHMFILNAIIKRAFRLPYVLPARVALMVFAFSMIYLLHFVLLDSIWATRSGILPAFIDFFARDEGIVLSLVLVLTVFLAIWPSMDSFERIDQENRSLNSSAGNDVAGTGNAGFKSKNV